MKNLIHTLFAITVKLFDWSRTKMSVFKADVRSLTVPRIKQYVRMLNRWTHNKLRRIQIFMIRITTQSKYFTVIEKYCKAQTFFDIVILNMPLFQKAFSSLAETGSTRLSFTPTPSDVSSFIWQSSDLHSRGNMEHVEKNEISQYSSKLCKRRWVPATMLNITG